MHSTSTVCRAVRALSRPWLRGRSRCKCSSRWMMTAAPVRGEPMMPGGKEADSRVTRFR
jgi:hypothetical protein